MGIFGGGKSSSQSTQTSQSSNQAYPELSTAFAPQISTGGAANAAIGNLLGLNGTTGTSASQPAYDDYLNSTGFKYNLNKGSEAITDNNAAKGMLYSGSTLKGLDTFGQNLNSQYFQQYLNQLLGLTTQGNTAGQIIAGAGQQSSSTGQSTGTSTQNPNLGGVIGGGLSMIASDPRLKTNISLIRRLDNGLGVYDFKYIWDNETSHRGYMANEVARITPEALGPVMHGYMTVDYSKLPEIN